MLRLLCNKKGITIVEVMTAIVLTSIGIMSLLALQNPGWKSVAKADYIGRATAILYKQLEGCESEILNPCITVPLGSHTDSNVHPSDQSTSISGDVTYTVVTSIAQDGASTTGFVVTVAVTWPPYNTAGISESVTVSRQEFNRYPALCTDNSLTWVWPLTL
jgi:Tfp pilus assembly protein PilV